MADNTQFKNIRPTGEKAPEKRKRRGAVSEYKKSLTEKQTLKNMYGLSERQFKRYVKESLDRMGRVENVSDELIRRLEKRLDNVVFRMGFAKSRAMSRQMVNHSYFTVNGKPVNIPSYQVDKDDVIALKETKKKKPMLKDLGANLKTFQTHKWLNVNKETWACNVIGEPTLVEVAPPVEISLIFEFYSR
ncbi:MAG: 30S ribosomal protein S4 [Candidatus Paceibacterales bacterium]